MRSPPARPALALTFALTLVASLAGCALATPDGAPNAAPAPASAPAAMDGDPLRPAAARWLRTELYLAVGRAPESPGADAPEGGVDELAWRAFLDEGVTPRFPDGFTVHDAYGQWRGREQGRIGRLRTRVIVILHPDTAEARARVEAVRSDWKARTGQDSALRATHAVEVSF